MNDFRCVRWVLHADAHPQKDTAKLAQNSPYEALAAGLQCS